MTFNFIVTTLILAIILVIGFFFFEVYLYIVETEKLKDEGKFNAAKNNTIKKKLY